jgi:peptidyl-prolyl cis-trans isomerase D
MFDLFRSRDKAVRTVLTVLLGLVALSMVAYLIPGGVGPCDLSNPQTVMAEVCGEPITMREVQMQLQAAMKNKNFPPEMVQNYIPEFVNQFVSERALACQAEDMGFIVSEQEVANAIRSMLPQVFQGGFNKEVYTMFLQQQNLTIPEFEANVKKQILLTKLRNLVLEATIVTPDEIEAEYRRRNEKIKIDYVSFSSDKFRSQVTLKPEEIQAYFNANRTAFRVPEKRSFDVLVANEDKIGASLAIDEAVLRQAYMSAGDRFRTGERVKVRHILLKTTDMSADDQKKQEARANDLLAKIKGGADFAKLATENSDDPGSKARGGDLDWVVKGQTVPNFEAAAFSLKKGELSSVVKTEYGFHILQVMDREDAKVKPFEEAKAELAAELKKQQVLSRMEVAMEQARAELQKNPKNAVQIAANLNLNYYRVNEARPGDPIQEIGIVPEFEQAIFAAQPNTVTNIVVAPGSKLALGVLTGITPARNAELSEVEQQVRDQLTIQKSREMMMAKQKEVADIVKSSPGDLKKVAAAVGGTVGTSGDFARDGAAEGLGSGAYFVELFAKEPGAMVGPINVMDQVVVARLAAKTPADMGQLAAERDTLLNSLKGRKAQERKDLFEDGLVAKLIDKGKIKINQDAIKRMMTSYRS